MSDPTPNPAYHLRIEGRVQGVGFRAWTQDTAGALQLQGWVANRPDGSVEAVVSGSEENCRAFLEKAKQGPSAARVSEITASESVWAGEGFEIRR